MVSLPPENSKSSALFIRSGFSVGSLSTDRHSEYGRYARAFGCIGQPRRKERLEDLEKPLGVNVAAIDVVPPAPELCRSDSVSGSPLRSANCYLFACKARLRIRGRQPRQSIRLRHIDCSGADLAEVIHRACLYGHRFRTASMWLRYDFQKDVLVTCRRVHVQQSQKVIDVLSIGWCVVVQPQGESCLLLRPGFHESKGTSAAERTH